MEFSMLYLLSVRLTVTEGCFYVRKIGTDEVCELLRSAMTDGQICSKIHFDDDAMLLSSLCGFELLRVRDLSMPVLEDGDKVIEVRSKLPITGGTSALEELEFYRIDYVIDENRQRIYEVNS